jgi:hypothetical protein
MASRERTVGLDRAEAESVDLEQRAQGIED